MNGERLQGEGKKMEKVGNVEYCYILRTRTV